MSLINQALKKAQRERNGPPAPDGPAPRQPGELRPTHAETQKSYQALTWMVGGGILVTGIVAAVALTIVLMSPKPEAPAEPPDESVAVHISLPKPAVEEPAEAVPESEPEPVVTQEAPVVVPETPAQESLVKAAPSPQSAPSPQTAPSPESTPTVAQAPSPEKAPEVRAPVPEQPAVTAPVAVAQEQAPVEVLPPQEPVASTPAPEPVSTPDAASTAAAEPVAQKEPAPPVMPEQPVAVAGELAEPEPAPPPDAPVAGAEPNPKVLAFLESSRITGIKVAGVHSRLLMNNQVYRKDDMVHSETKLRIKEIAANEILFVDESGIQYRKQFRR